MREGKVIGMDTHTQHHTTQRSEQKNLADCPCARPREASEPHLQGSKWADADAA